MKEAAALVLAAGYSSRLGRLKPLLPLGEASLVSRAVGLFIGAGVSDVLVVTGHRAEDLAPEVERAGGRVVVNPEFSQGMFTSVLAGLKELPPEAQAFFVLPVDVPLVRPGTLVRVWERFRQDPEAIVRPNFQGTPGHPPLIPARFRTDILAWDGTQGLRGWMLAGRARLVDIETPDQGVLIDMDTPEDYELVKQRWSRSGRSHRGRGRSHARPVLGERFSRGHPQPGRDQLGPGHRP